MLALPCLCRDGSGGGGHRDLTLIVRTCAFDFILTWFLEVVNIMLPLLVMVMYLHVSFIMFQLICPKAEGLWFSELTHIHVVLETAGLLCEATNQICLGYDSELFWGIIIQNELSSKGTCNSFVYHYFGGAEVLVQEHVSVHITVKILIRFIRMS